MLHPPKSSRRTNNLIVCNAEIHLRLWRPVVWIVQPLNEKQSRSTGRETQAVGNGFELYVSECRSIHSRIRSLLFSRCLTEHDTSMESDARGWFRLH
jgi:hypothetical protein